MNTIIAYPESGEQADALKSVMKALKIDFDEEIETVKEKKSYNPEFVAELEISLQQEKEGKAKTIDKADFRKYLGLE